MSKSLTLSPRLKQISIDAYKQIKISPGINKNFLAEELRVPKPILNLALLPLIKCELIESTNQTNLFATKKEVSPLLLPTIIHQGEKRISPSAYDAFISACTKEKVNKPEDFSKTIFKELTIEEYLKNKEFYDYGSTTIFYSNNSLNPYFLNEYFYRQLSKNLNNVVPELKNHTFIAINEGQIIALVSFSNYNSCTELKHHLPCKNSAIFNVSFLATRKDCQGKGVASELLKMASEDLINKEEVFALNYLPINNTSEHIMRKTFGLPPFFIKERTYSPKDERIFGSLNQFIIFHENQQTLEYENID